ncbi:cyclin CLN1 [Ascoidea rubescens DSM 1968]|uniref:Cyclin-like protein n=1 Tax=Ascoidea rubescens DSM 1968 TaxID=1344418 RepID=A0A1D2VAL2_9ASCO|nr:cyclin-like protein [Ascoidea rubescens DSM 1968]ODV58639.1 cyclin-like protein [Ascoidea rubescens DSM 1968]
MPLPNRRPIKATNLYPKALVDSEINAHKQAINEYQDELSINLYSMASDVKPDINLIRQQPELKSNLRAPLLDFLFKIAVRTKVTTGIFYKAARLIDRYCSKRVVLRDQAQLVAGTCLLLAAKTSGGCNHIISSANVPTGGRFLGPTIRSRIPRLNELVQLCGPSCGYDEGMFTQMEMHILDTLEWNVCDPSIYNWAYNLYDYQTLNNESNTPSNFDFKKIIFIKNFLIDCSLYSTDLVSVHPAELSVIIKKILITLITNDDTHFDISNQNLKKIISDNNFDEYNTSAAENTATLINNTTCFNMNLANKLLLSVANASTDLLNHYTNIDPLFNNIISSIHKVAISHILALNEENNKSKYLDQHQQQQRYASSSVSSSSQYSSYCRSPVSPYSNSDYDSSDVESVMSGDGLSILSTNSSPMTTPGSYAICCRSNLNLSIIPTPKSRKNSPFAYPIKQKANIINNFNNNNVYVSFSSNKNASADIL